MKFYFVSPWLLLKFVALGLGIGFSLASDFSLNNWWAAAIIIVVTIYISSQILHILIFTKNSITCLRYNSILNISYNNIKSFAVQGRDIAKTKKFLWPTSTPNDVDIVDNKMLFIVIQFKSVNKKRRIPIRIYTLQDRTRIIQTILERIKQY